MQEHFDRVAKELADLRLAAFPDVFFTGRAKGRPLSIMPANARGRVLRLSLAAEQCFHLSEVQVTARSADGTPVMMQPKGLRTSSVYKNTGVLIEERALFSPDEKKYGFHTEREKCPWVEIDLGESIDLLHLFVANRNDGQEERAWTLRIEVYDAVGQSTVIYDHQARMQALASVIEAAAPYRRTSGEFAAGTELLCRCYAAVVRLEFEAARELVDKATHVPSNQREAIRRALNNVLLPEFERQWNIHGIRRTFRFWSESEKKAYLGFANEVFSDLRELTSNVCFGFGAVLAIVRDRALLPHDDDLDILISFRKEECPTISAGIARVVNHLESRGYKTRGQFASHRQIYRGAGKSIDVFVGLEEDGKVSWYPQPRGNLNVEDVFPTIRAKLLGVECAIPKNPFAYLEAVYGASWGTPNARWGHKWDKSAYADIL